MSCNFACSKRKKGIPTMLCLLLAASFIHMPVHPSIFAHRSFFFAICSDFMPIRPLPAWYRRNCSVTLTMYAYIFGDVMGTLHTPLLRLLSPRACPVHIRTLLCFSFVLPSIQIINLFNNS